MEDKKETIKKGSFSKTLLDDKEKKNYDFVTERILNLQKVRQSHYGHNLDVLFSDADRDYIPHRLGTTGKRVIATDEDKGWRGQRITIGADDWQSDVSQANPLIKIQIALSILIDQNPSGAFTAANRKFQATTEIIKQLYQRSWEHAKSKAQLKLFVFNLAKYGWATARTYPLRIARKVQVLKDYNQEDPSKTVYEEKEIIEYNDIMRENLDPRNVWLDDMARPNNPFSIKDWCWRKVYDYDIAKEEFGKYKFFDYVQEGKGNLDDTVGVTANKNKVEADNSKKVELFFYENRIKDLFFVIAGGSEGVPIVMEPLPIADSKGLKKLSIWQTYWNLRHTESPYGIGIYEAIRYDQGMLDRIRNMTVDQIVMSIYKMFFYQGTQSLTDTGDIKIKPGVGKQVLDPKNVNWLEIPGPGRDAYLGIEMFKHDVDEASGITDPLMGAITGKTAFEIAQAKESALKRLKNPLDNILDALNEEGYITISLMQLLYSIPETYQISDPLLIEDYLKEVQSDPELYERTSSVDENGQQQDTFTAKVYPEFPLNLDKDEKGNLIETQDTAFFRTKPSALNWEGVVSIKSQSLLSPSKQVEKALDLEMYNLLIPLMQTIAQERMMVMQSGALADLDELTNGKTAKAIVKLYDKDPRDIFPDSWLKEQEQPMFVPAQPADQGIPQPGGQTPQQGQSGPNRLVSSTQPPSEPRGMVGKIMSRITAPFK